MKLAPLLLLFVGCANVSQSFKDCSKQAAEKLIVPTVETAILCGSDKVCLEQEARRTALVVADELVACASTSQDGGGHDRN